MDMPLVSIIIPVYNTEKYVCRCLESVLLQSYKNIEVIVVNDGSTDSSGEICEGFALMDRRVVVHHQSNQGVSSARNFGISVASGKYIFFADSDDVVPKDSIKSLLDSTNSCDYGLVMGKCEVIGKETKFDYLKANHAEYTNKSLCVEMTLEPSAGLLMSAVWGKLFLNEVIKKHALEFDTSLINGEDGLFVLNYLENTERIFNSDILAYSLYRYDECERVSAVSALYYDFIYFYTKFTEKLLLIVGDNISPNDNILFNSNLINGMISYLVRAIAYEEHFNKQDIRLLLSKIVKSEWVEVALRSYCRTDPKHSILIPFCLKCKSHFGLYFALRCRSRKYLKRYPKKLNVKSVFKQLDA